MKVKSAITCAVVKSRRRKTSDRCEVAADLYRQILEPKPPRNYEHKRGKPFTCPRCQRSRPCGTKRQIFHQGERIEVCSTCL